MGSDAFRYDFKRALVVGGASGMGEATAALLQELGADVIVMDSAEVTLPGVTSINVDLREASSIDAALDECGGPIHALFACAGVADGTAGIEKINFIGHRHLIERALERQMLTTGSAVAFISSTGGLGWESNLDLLNEYLDAPDFAAATRWIESHPDKASYSWSKQAICAYVGRECVRFLRQGVRLNAIMPGPTDTPLAQANADVWLQFGADFRDHTGTKASTPDEQAHVLAFLCSDAASYVNGLTMVTDLGYVSAGITGGFAPATGIVRFLRGKS
jgi:NAD(P)-dependent dehydrogenase (short-subunit alcohol dehydrogenase family)